MPHVNAEKTLGDLKSELAGLRQEKIDNENSKALTQDEINAQNAQISSAYNDIQQAETDIEIAKADIEKSNKKIEETKEDTSKLLVFYELVQDDNGLLDYISGATTMTDLMMRAEDVAQILKYNKAKLNNLENLIETKEKLQVDLKKQEEILEGKITEYEANVAALKNDLSSLVEMALDIDSQINAQQELIEYYENIGCKDDQTLSSCVDVVNNSGWLRPTNQGYISSTFGYRSFMWGGVPYSDFHAGIDIAGNDGGTPIYATASGTVAAIIWRASCGGNQVFIHTRVNGVDYTIQFAHMMDVYVSVGQKVNTQTVVGTIGGGGYTIVSNGGWDTCSTGYHLHYNVAYGFYLGDGYSSYSQFVANSFSAPALPAYGNWYYSRY